MYGPGRSSTCSSFFCAKSRKRSRSAKPVQVYCPGRGSCRFHGTYTCTHSTPTPLSRALCGSTLYCSTQRPCCCSSCIRPCVLTGVHCRVPIHLPLRCKPCKPFHLAPLYKPQITLMQYWVAQKTGRAHRYGVQAQRSHAQHAVLPLLWVDAVVVQTAFEAQHVQSPIIQKPQGTPGW